MQFSHLSLENVWAYEDQVLAEELYGQNQAAWHFDDHLEPLVLPERLVEGLEVNSSLLVPLGGRQRLEKLIEQISTYR